MLFAVVRWYLAINRFVIPPRFSLTVDDPVGVGPYLGIGLAVTASSDVMHATQRQERDGAD